ncbi:SubName: Full=Uncharacterized protein {ECO:0000313/EMBL:CCA74979.1} [Serendipita indica DSM 11827]|nr:SubName: Full=Uncharacterized protein {ECO:0000313/EMBL:CCA74979.1} [Serendipita indica DSM 11827]
MAEAEHAPTLPSLRELQLEELLRTRELQIQTLNNELLLAKKQLPALTPHGLVSEEAVSAAAMAALMPHLVNERNAINGIGSSELIHPGLVAALRQRATMLQEENDELYTVLRRAETGRLDEEVKGLRRLVDKLERALRESNEKVQYLSGEMAATTELLARDNLTPVHPRRQDREPTPSRGSRSPHDASPKPHHQPPTGPRSKKPRTYLSPPPAHTRPDDRTRQPHRSPSFESKSSDRSHVPPPSRAAGMDMDSRRDRDRRRPERDMPSPTPRERDRSGRDNQHGRATDSGPGPSGDANGLQIRGYARSKGDNGNQGRSSPRRSAGGPPGRANGLPNRPDRGLAERMGL